MSSFIDPGVDSTGGRGGTAVPVTAMQVEFLLYSRHVPGTRSGMHVNITWHCMYMCESAPTSVDPSISWLRTAHAKTVDFSAVVTVVAADQLMIMRGCGYALAAAVESRPAAHSAGMTFCKKPMVLT